jgi:hypothetical protein
VVGVSFFLGDKKVLMIVLLYRYDPATPGDRVTDVFEECMTQYLFEILQIVLDLLAPTKCLFYVMVTLLLPKWLQLIGIKLASCPYPEMAILVCCAPMYRFGGRAYWDGVAVYNSDFISGKYADQIPGR